jgi:HPt (histidine-containing phosphotransfer) domain-containing protein
MKGALANIGEADLSAFAYRLEQAGRERNIGLILAETPAFVAALRTVIEKFTAQAEDEDLGAADENHAYLREKLLVVQSACDAYDKKTAKATLAELQQKAWSRQTRDQINTIAEHLLHSDFDDAAALAEKIVRTI